MDLVFTLAQNRTLSNAICLGESLLILSPHLRFCIGLVDVPTKNPIYGFDFDIIEVDSLKIDGLESMASRYTTEEFLAAMKPYFAAHFLKEFSKVYYFEAKSIVLGNLTPKFKLLDAHNMVLTPQLNKARQIKDEKQVLNTGIFTSACWGLKASTETDKILNWWLSKMPEKAGFQPCEGIYSDQLWMNHLPVLFEGVYVDKAQDMNIGLWDFEEKEGAMHHNYSNYQTDLYKGLISRIEKIIQQNTIPAFGRYTIPTPVWKLKLVSFFRNTAQVIDNMVSSLSNLLYR